MNIDHHLQQTIVELLKSSDGPVRYTGLKDPTIENSLFSYHLNKLLARDIVQKIDDGYSLTIEGARWLNDNGSSIRQSEVARVFMALLVQDETGNYLVGQRIGQMKATINDYMLPSVSYDNNDDLPDQVQRATTTFIPKGHLADRRDCGFVQIKATYTDDAVMRALFHVTSVQVRHFGSVTTNTAAFEWMSREQINAIDHPSTRILQGLIDRVGSVNDSTPTPVIVG